MPSLPRSIASKKSPLSLSILRARAQCGQPGLPKNVMRGGGLALGLMSFSMVHSRVRGGDSMLTSVRLYPRMDCSLAN
jgi:hypothetical protein